MATQNNVDIKVNVTDGGTTAKATKSAEQYKKTLEDAGKAAASISTGSVGGTAGSRAVAAAAAAPVKTAKTVSQPTGSAAIMDDSSYNAARGAAGATKASARDFAKQSRDLDGLVRVYATFAANIYAVGAAFRALSDAAATENLVKGLDSLGAASGKNLGFLSKQLVVATDGAISLKDAMTAVATASSAGMGSSQIKEIAVVASKASQALGVNMADAMSRLSRGITKLEPELLDELGIFTKVGEATSKYALAVGKSVTSLSDFEKRQAFANAVIAEGKKKFEELDTVTNPYDKLLASVTNLSTEGLGLVNKVLGPIIKLLSESPTALLGIFAAVGSALIKQAIPALGAWRESLAKSAEASAASAERIHTTFMEYSVDKDIAESAKRLKPAQEKVAKNLAEGQDLLASTLSKRSKILASAMLPNVNAEGLVKSLDTEISKRNVALDITAAKRDAEYAKGEKANQTLLGVLDRRITRQHEELLNLGEARDIYKDTANIVKKIQEDTEKFDNRNIKLFSFERGFKDSGEWMRKRIADAAQASATSKGILSAAGSDTATKGTIAAFKNLFDSIKNGIPKVDEFGEAIVGANGKVERIGKGLTGIPAILTKVTGSLLIAGSAIGTFLSSIQPILIVLELLVVAYGVFDSVASKAAKQQEAFNTATAGVESATKTAADTLTLYTQKKKEAFTIDAISAYTNAISGASDALRDQIIAFQDYKKSANIWDDLKDGIASVFGKGNLDKLQKGAVDSLKTTMNMLDYSSNSGASKTSLITSIFGDKAQFKDLNASTKELNKAFDGLTDAEREAKINKIAAAVENVRKSEEYATNAAKAFLESLSAVDKVVDQIIQANAFSDLQGKLGIELVQAAQKLAMALSDPLKALTDLAALGKDPKALAALNIAPDSSAMSALKQAVTYERQLNDLTKERKLAEDAKVLAEAGKGTRASALQKAESNVPFFGDLGGTTSSTARLRGAAVKGDIQDAKAKLDEIAKKIKDAQREATSFASNQISLVTQIAQTGFDRIQLGLKRAQEQAQIGVARTALNIAAGAGANTADKEFALKMQELKIQESLIEANYNVQLATIKNTQELEKLNINLQQGEAARLKASSLPEEQIAGQALEKSLAQRKRIIDLAEGKSSKQDLLSMRGSSVEAQAAIARRNELLIPGMQKDAALAATRGQAQSAELERQAKINAEELRNKEAKLNLENQILATQQEQVNLANQLGISSTDQLIDLKYALQFKQASNEADAKRAAVEAKIKDLKVAGITSGPEYERLAGEQGIYTQTLKQITAEETLKKLKLEYSKLDEKGAEYKKRINKEYELTLEDLRIENSLLSSNIVLEQLSIDAKSQLGAIDAQSAIIAKANLELRKEDIRYAEDALKLENDVANKKRDAADAAAKTALALNATQGKGLDSPEMQAFRQAQDSQDAAERAYQTALKNQSAAKTLSDINKQGINDTKALNLELERQKQLFADITAATESLAAIFGTVGESVGKFAETLAKVSLQNEANKKGMADNKKLQTDLLEKQKQGVDITQALSDAKEEESRLTKKSQKDELNGNIAVVASAKKMFGEKTAAAKALGDIEKVLHVQRIAMDLKEMVQKLFTDTAETNSKLTAEATQTGATEAGFLARTGTYISEIFAKFTATMGPWGWAAAAAVVAAIFGGGGGSSAPFVATAEQQQKVQGTAMSYNSTGSLVQTNRGVFGDTTAKSESIAKSLDIIESTSVEGLSYYNGMLDALKQIRDNTGTAAKNLYNIPGLRAGSLSGTIEGTNTSGGLLGIGGLFSKSVTKDIIDSGIKLSGTFGELVRGISSTIQTFETVSTTVKKSGFLGIGGSTSTSVDTTYQDLLGLDPKSFKALVDSLNNANNLVMSIAKTADLDLTAVQSTLDALSVDKTISLRGLKGEDFTKELSSVIGQILDDASSAIFTQFEQFAQFGEGMLETVVRVIDANTKVKQSLENSFISISNILGENGYKVTEALVNLAGGLQNFIDGTTFYQENFLTERERLAPVLKSTGDELGRIVKMLGYTVPDGAIDTREEFTKLVKSLDLTTDTGQKAYTALMNVAPGFDKLMDYVDQFTSDAISKMSDLAKTFKDFAKQISDFRSGLLLGSLSTATPLEKLSAAKTDYSKTLAAAMGGDKDALGKLTSSASTYLEQAKSMYASSSTYTDIFNQVNQQLADAEKYAGDTADLAQQQVDALNAHTQILANIDAGISKLAGIDPIQAAATGGWRQGLTLVGEKGPEIVDFQTPGRVYTADQTRGMFSAPVGGNQQAVVAELQALRKEVAQLRQDQQQQTGDLINTNYDATNTLAAHVVDAVAKSTVDANWQSRTQVTLK
jgi:hypothetical protein